MTPQRLLRHIKRITAAGTRQLLVVVNPHRMYEYGLGTEPYDADNIEWFTGDMDRVTKIIDDQKISATFMEASDGQPDNARQIYNHHRNELRRRSR